MTPPVPNFGIPLLECGCCASCCDQGGWYCRQHGCLACLHWAKATEVHAVTAKTTDTK